MDKNGYGDELKEEDCHTILKYGIACYKKRAGCLWKRKACRMQLLSGYSRREAVLRDR